MSAHLLSINMVSYNTKDITIQAIRSIDRSLKKSWIRTLSHSDVELVVVDNASTDGTCEAIHAIQGELCFDVKVIRQTDNIGFGRGHNLAASSSDGEYVLLINTDTMIVEDGLSKLFSVYLTYNKPVSFETAIKYDTSGLRRHFIGPKLLNPDLTPQSSAGAYFTIPTIIGMLFLFGDRWGLTRSSPGTATQTDWVSGACFICKKEYFVELGGFDSQIFMYMEEVELFHRAAKKGMTIWFEPSARVVHIGSASSNKSYPVIQLFRGLLYLYKTHHSPKELALVQYLLQLKARISIIIGIVFGKPYLVETYTRAREQLSL
ncbi:MAG: glycosyltransferase family 2 protein [bacterium]